MKLARAYEIVAAINGLCFATMEIEQKRSPIPLKGISLAEMMAAKNAIEAKNRRAERAAKANGKGYSISMIPADRLIAAAYVFENYQPSREPILCIPHRSWDSTHKCVAVITVNENDMAADDEDEEAA